MYRFIYRNIHILIFTLFVCVIFLGIKTVRIENQLRLLQSNTPTPADTTAPIYNNVYKNNAPIKKIEKSKKDEQKQPSAIKISMTKTGVLQQKDCKYPHFAKNRWLTPIDTQGYLENRWLTPIDTQGYPENGWLTSIDSQGYLENRWLTPIDTQGYLENRWLTPIDTQGYPENRWLTPIDTQGYLENRWLTPIDTQGYPENGWLTSIDTQD